MKYGAEIQLNLLGRMNNPRISIVIPCYNSEKTIARTLKSIATQDYNNIEVIVVDGLSSDSTIEIVNNYQEIVSKVISEPDSGIYNAINKGIELCDGELIGMISSNDWLRKGAIKALLTVYAKSPDSDIYHANIFMIKYIRGKGYYKERKGESPQQLSNRMTIMHPTCFVKKEWYQRFKYNESYSIAGDYDFLLRSFLQNATFSYFNEVLIVMSDGGLSTSFKTTIETVMIQFQYGLYLNAITLFLNRLFLFYKSKTLRVVANIVLPQKLFEKLEVKKWGGHYFGNENAL